MRRILALTAVAVLLIGVVGVPGAGAAKPEVVDEFEFTDGPYPWQDLAGDVINCKDGVRHFGPGEDFTVLHQVSGEGVHIHQPIKGGDVVKHTTTVGGVDYLINSSDDSKVATGKWHQNIRERLTPADEPLGQFTVTGLLWHVVAPGFGTIFHESGQLVLDFRLLPEDPFVAFHGRSDVGAFEYDAVCEALA